MELDAFAQMESPFCAVRVDIPFFGQRRLNFSAAYLEGRQRLENLDAGARGFVIGIVRAIQTDWFSALHEHQLVTLGILGHIEQLTAQRTGLSAVNPGSIDDGRPTMRNRNHRYEVLNQLVDLQISSAAVFIAG